MSHGSSGLQVTGVVRNVILKYSLQTQFLRHIGMPFESAAYSESLDFAVSTPMIVQLLFVFSLLLCALRVRL